MNKITHRQNIILQQVSKFKKLDIKGIIDALTPAMGALSKATINRDLADLMAKGSLLKEGSGRATLYKLPAHRILTYPFDIDPYFEKNPGERDAKTDFDFSVFDHLENLFDDSEKKHLEKLAKKHQKNLANIHPQIYKKEFERLTIEFSWKSSQIEGNTYSLFETEALLSYHQKAKGHSKEEAQMILNHKNALDFIGHTPDDFQQLSLNKITSIHDLLIKDLGVERGLRKKIVAITGTAYKPLDNPYQIEDAIKKLCDTLNHESFAYAKAMIANLMIAYIQPFMDGNKRTSRMLGNAILLAHRLCPISYRDIEPVDYKKAVLLFYEQNNLSAFKKLFIEQAEFAVQNYFLT